MMMGMVRMIMLMREWGWAERGGCEARWRRGGGGIEIEVELTGWCQDEMESSLGKMGVGGGACDTATGGRCSTTADLGGTGQVFAKYRGVVIRGLFQLKQGQRGQSEGRR